MEDRVYRQQVFTGERALFRTHGARIVECVFTDGESPLKECNALTIESCAFRWKYPLWYCENVTVTGSVWGEIGRAGVWYTNRLQAKDCLLEAPKNFRRCRDLTLENVSFSNAAETLWACENVRLKNVTVTRGDYFGMNCREVEAENLTLYGNYGFDGAENVRLADSKLLTKDAFWNCRNVTVENSFISGEYLGWNSENLTFVNCTIESLQGLCYVKNLTLRNCRLLNTTLAFEYSTVDAEVVTPIDSVFNPAGGVIRAERIGELTLDPAFIDPAATRIETEA